MKTFKELCIKHNTTMYTVSKITNIPNYTLTVYNRLNTNLLNIGIDRAFKISGALGMDLNTFYEELKQIEENKKECV